MLPKKYFKKYRPPLVELPDLIQPQRESYKWFVETALKEVFKEFSPISDYSDKKFELVFKKYELGKAKCTPEFAKENKLTYDAPLRASVVLKNKTLASDKEQEIFFADIPVMTDHGTFIINGVERVIVPQLARSYGIFFTTQEQKGRTYFGAKIIPARGAWVEIESEADGAIYVKIDRKRKFPVTALLRVFGVETEKEMLALFKKIPGGEAYLKTTLEKDPAKTTDDAFIEIYRRLRDGDLATVENAREFIGSIFASARYDLSEIGRHHFNERSGRPTDKKATDERTVSLDDLITILDHIIVHNATPGATADDIDHLGFRRVRYFGEMLQQRVRVGLTRMKRNIQDRMSTIEAETSLPIQLINPRPLQAAIKEFFTTNQLSQFMPQQNILAELEGLRTLSALGPGGLTRERAGFEVRDVHTSHYGRLCPIHTPEGPNIGLILRLSMYSRVNRFGIIETPYAKVVKGVVTGEIVYLNAHEEEKFAIAHAATNVDDSGKIMQDIVEARRGGEPRAIEKNEIDFMDVATNQAFSVATSMIPFLNHDDANRALMGSNMQKQATPCIVPEAPLVATGIEEIAARDTGRVLFAKEAGDVVEADAKHVVVKGKDGKKIEYPLISFQRTNDFSAFYHRCAVTVGDKLKRGDLIADTSSTDNGQMALGQNALVAFMSWNGANYEDAIIISERLVKDSKFATVHMDELEVSVRDTKLGPEVTTPDIPNVSEQKLRNLDENGIIRIGAEVRTGDILVGKVTPKGETQLTPEERLLRSIFGEKAKDVKDTSLRLEAGKRGRVIGVKIFSRENGDQLESGVIKRIHITVAQVRNVSVGDKLAGRHGNKGVISRILPEEDMPYTEDGKPIDILLTPLGVPSRMNLGQILELHLGMAANTLGYQAIVPPFAGATEDEIKDELEAAGFERDGKLWLRDGRTGEQFAQKTSVGYMYILKLHHMVEDKIHMRSIGPYSLITQQPLGGKAQVGGQRFGEMEVWALLGYGAAYTLREMLTIKSDDIVGRSAAFDAIVRGERIAHPHTPAAFNVLVNQLRGLALDIDLKREDMPRLQRRSRN
ncbi:DNA-directed RNA polymerase subunit beta [Candidatus Parcubacteria bacterium]|uniref:DNA-directed RNA polymerase subunit beta n=1 Tax=Candidatus Kaiserbacteria bacterium CG10_big_fil_rev_8_21_14_0_10_47_16 TaxID=1974608 RepID=A0A2H0UEK2_9BACT|nr:DNA-directed RNA polymerase subunit beta [Candidatus Parcubacteria bacterium]PIR84817.1 MAG: DNA-directed RNA polymerase subunit beta [Candidatus Kaiserbacteria bacterium CG10_big_fil_rev_8_21_14_0_10_47_16]